MFFSFGLLDFHSES